MRRLSCEFHFRLLLCFRISHPLQAIYNILTDKSQADEHLCENPASLTSSYGNPERSEYLIRKWYNLTPNQTPAIVSSSTDFWTEAIQFGYSTQRGHLGFPPFSTHLGFSFFICKCIQTLSFLLLLLLFKEKIWKTLESRTSIQAIQRYQVDRFHVVCHPGRKLVVWLLMNFLFDIVERIHNMSHIV